MAGRPFLSAYNLIASCIVFRWMLQNFIGDNSTFVRYQAIAWANVDPELGRYIASQGNTELNSSKCSDIMQ